MTTRINLDICNTCNKHFSHGDKILTIRDVNVCATVDCAWTNVDKNKMKGTVRNIPAKIWLDIKIEEPSVFTRIKNFLLGTK